MEAVLWHKPGTADITIPTLYHRIIRQHRLKGTSDITYRIPQSTSALRPTGKLRQKDIQPHSHGPHTELQAESREQNLPSGPDDARDALPNIPNSSEVFWGWRGERGGGGDAGGLDCLSGLPWLQGHPSRLGSTSRVQTGQRVTASNPEVKSSSGDGKTNMSTQSMPYNLFQFTSSHAYKI